MTTLVELPLADAIGDVGDQVRNVQIQISFDVVKLLSEQLYASPVKAVEELVVNGWDAGADRCSVFVDQAGKQVVAVLDDGAGMDLQQLSDLWHIGVSHKPPLERPRKQIGKFGIGKLASYAVARRATYITESVDGLLAVTINFDELANQTNSETGEVSPLELQIRRLDLEDLQQMPAFQKASAVLQLEDGAIIELAQEKTWTLVVLEELRERSKALVNTNRLAWVLKTAMPRATDFALFLNGNKVSSIRDEYDQTVSFRLHELEPRRIEALNRDGEDWRVQGESLVSTKFPSGIDGNAIVTEQSLYKAGGKSEDLGRSHGFFVRVHGRLINETDPLFGARPLSFTTWYRFAADIEASDLNPYITAARDDLEQSELKPALRALLIEVFNQARDRTRQMDDEAHKLQRQKPETEREYVSRRIVEQPLADALVMASQDLTEDGLDRRWSLVEPVEDLPSLNDLVADLYKAEPKRRAYTYRYSALGDNEPFVNLDPRASVLTLNEDHPLVGEFGESPDSRRVLELFSAAETLLEAYLFEAGIPHEIVRELLTRRDLLLRSLSQDESQSLKAIAKAVRETSRESEDSKAFEIAVVGALRALGFSAQHISGSGTPDGIAEYQVYGADGVKLTLETKASSGTPSLGAIDIAGLQSHASAVGARGTLVVAPTYPGIDDPTSEVNKRATLVKVSLWTADQLARLVEVAEAKHLNARDLQGIVLTDFAAPDVAAAIELLLGQRDFSKQAVYQGVVAALESLQGRLRDLPRTVDMVAAEVSRLSGLESVNGADVQAAVVDLASVSRGLLHVTEDRQIAILGDIEELKRRVSGLTQNDASPRRLGTFRAQ